MKAALIAFVATLICFANGTGLLGGANEVTNSEDRKSYANKALEQLERSTNSINARKIVEVSFEFLLDFFVDFTKKYFFILCEMSNFERDSFRLQKSSHKS